MKLLILLIALLWTKIAIGQESQEVIIESDFKKWYLGVNISPDYCFRSLHVCDENATNESAKAFRNSIETQKFGHTTGIDLNIYVRRKLGIGLGVEYSNKGYSAKMSDLIFGTLIDPRSGFIGSNTYEVLKEVRINYNYHYLDFPIKVFYIYGNRKIRFISSAGIALNFLLEENSIIIKEYEDGSQDKNSSITNNDNNRLNISPFLSAGIDWKLKNKNRLRIEPAYRYGALGINDDPVASYLWSAGLNVSFYFGLR